MLDVLDLMFDMIIFGALRDTVSSLVDLSRNLSNLIFDRIASHLEKLPLNDFASQNMQLISTRRGNSHVEMLALKDVAPWNIDAMLTTFETFQLDMSALKDVALANM